jgi:hypothetical protein
MCLADVSERPFEPGTCYLCWSPLAGHEHRLQRQQLNTAYQESLTVLEQLDEAVQSAAREAQHARNELKLLSDQLDGEAQDSVTPFVDAIKASSAELADITARLDALGRLQDAHDRLAEQYTHIEALKTRQTERRDRLVLRGADVEDSKEVISRITKIFRRIICSIELPHATGRARVDPETLLPWVDEQSFTQRGGGARSAVSIAYSLALLTYTLENDIATLPSLLIIDSPQKNFGSNKNDKLLAHRVYERFWT